jgi:methyl-accepting chemotaxis protein
MNWFKNLNAAPRLMLSFGFLIVLTLGMGYLGVRSLSRSNRGSQQLYQDEMLGSLRADQIAIDRLEIAKSGRDAVLHAGDPAIVAGDEKQVADSFASLKTNLEESQQLSHSSEALAQLEIIQQTLPAYAQVHADAFRALKEGRFMEAIAALSAGAPLGDRIRDASQACRQISQDLALARNAANDRSYRTTRSLIFAACTLSLVLGLALSISIARGFSEPLRQHVAALEKVAAGDWTVAFQAHSRDETGRMAGALDNALAKVRSTLREVAETATVAGASSRQLAAATAAIADGARQQASSLVETSASLEKMTTAVRQSADSARHASQLAVGSRESAEQGRTVVQSAITAMAEINTASARISDIITAIDEIAFQTNLLAVNAAVEAARAGEQGRGFAVVAAEVRSLAMRSAESAREIKSLIQDSLHKVGKGTELVNRSGDVLKGILASVKQVTDIIAGIAASAADQTTGIEQVNHAMAQVDRVTRANSAQTQNLASTSETLSRQSTRLSELVGVLLLNYTGKDRRGSGGNRRGQPAYAGPERRSRDGAKPEQRVAPAKPAPPAATPRPAASSSPHPVAIPRAQAEPAPAGMSLRRPQAPRSLVAAGPGADANFEEF